MQRTGPVTTDQRLRELFDAAVHGGGSSPAPSPRSRRPSVEGHDTLPQERRDQAAEQGVYIISVAARILAMHPQTLRKYERAGLVRPSRTMGMLRLYSDEDIAKLRMIKHLVDELRLNLAGVEMALAVFDRLVYARRQMAGSSAASRIFEQTVHDILELLQGRQGRSLKERV